MTNNLAIASSNELHYVIKSKTLVELVRYISDNKKVKPLSVFSTKLLNYALSLLDPNATELHDITISAKQFWEEFYGTTYKGTRHAAMIHEAVLELRNQTTLIPLLDEITGEEYLAVASWLRDIEIRNNAEDFVLRFDTRLKPLLLQLKDDRIKYPPIYVARIISR